MPTLQRVADAGLLYSHWSTTTLPALHRAPPRAPLPDISAPSLATTLRNSGWNTYWVGSGHNVPVDEWCAGHHGAHSPLAAGYDHLHGVIGLGRDPQGPASLDEHQDGDAVRAIDITREIVDKALSSMRESRSKDPNTPWLMWLNPLADATDSFIPEKYLRQYRGVFDDGYEAYRLSMLPRMMDAGIIGAGHVQSRHGTDAGTRPWRTLNPDERARLLRNVEHYAAAMEYADAEVGRVIDELAQTQQLKDTLIVWCAASGAASLQLGGWSTAFRSPGEPHTALHASRGTALGPLVMSWPGGINARGEVRHQHHHCTDLVPTILECCGVQLQETSGAAWPEPYGTSMCYTFNHATSPRTTSARALSFL
jgi:arylsulfatase